MPITNTTCPNWFLDLPTALSASSAQARPANAQWYNILHLKMTFFIKNMPPHIHIMPFCGFAWPRSGETVILIV